MAWWLNILGHIDVVFVMFSFWIHWFWYVVLSLVFVWMQKGGKVVNCSGADSDLTETEGRTEGGI